MPMLMGTRNSETVLVMKRETANLVLILRTRRLSKHKTRNYQYVGTVFEMQFPSNLHIDLTSFSRNGNTHQNFR